MSVPEMKFLPHRDLDAAAARKITERIKSSMGDIMADIAKAHMGRVWIALGYPTWGDYIKGEFDHAPLSLPTAERRAVSSLLRGQGMSTRAIAAVTDVDQSSVVRDLAANQVMQDASPESEPLDVEIDEDALAEELIAAEPVKITGLDNKSYQPNRPSPLVVAVQPAPAQTVTCPTCHGTGKVTQ